MQMSKTIDKNYWDKRSSSVGFTAYFRDKLIDSFLFPIASFIFSTRISDQWFIKQALSDSKGVLDVACGVGKKIIASKSYAAGVDIAGFPEYLAKSIGYDELSTYEPPSYQFSIAEKVDSITIINLNAHISFDAFLAILKSSLEFLKDGGRVVMINEYNNDGLSYKIFHQNQKSLDRFVNGMEHFHFEYEDQFLEKLNRDTNLKLLVRKPLTGSFLPFMHYIAYFLKTSNYRLWKIPSLIFDAIFGVINSLQCRFLNLNNKSFLVGYEFTKAKD